MLPTGFTSKKGSAFSEHALFAKGTPTINIDQAEHKKADNSQ